MNNLDFSAEPLFSWYVVMLAISGVIMLVLGALNLGGGLKIGWRIVNVLAGLGFLGYAYYLAFVFEGGRYEIFLKAFILPVALIVHSVKAIVERSNAKAQQPVPPGAPYGPAAGYQNVPPQAAAFDPNAPQAPYNPNAPQAPYGPGAPQPGAAVPPPAAPYQQGVPAPQAALYAPPAQAVPNNPYAQPVPPAQPGQPQPPYPAG
ncbi:hypothetical protein P3T27_001157 [Kitasatospora sp. MAA19]|uniref:hypothetical protein n=1 Tax=Kitasatospora sp. MAA19 TaxID=3035090 RepID=UPI0024730225|nr:hypothetical protein [Kitasatospora sp. MAA19]MDH6704454.1 hypothetical protein [Kitasatospora sp. MAA19]